jgi:hypothetical protein
MNNKSGIYRKKCQCYKGDTKKTDVQASSVEARTMSVLLKDEGEKERNVIG